MNAKFHEFVDKMISTYIAEVKNDVRDRWNQLSIDLAQKEVFEVLTGLLSRQVTLATQLAINPNCWTMDLAPIILRSMADNYINFSWIAQNPVERSQKFILHGLGQEKLVLEHRKNQLLKDGQNSDEDSLIKMTEFWLNNQRYTFLTEVNIGSWSGISTRQMAEEAGDLDFYNYVYTPFSTAVHNMWGHIARHNLRESDNPLHQYLKVPVLDDPNIDLYNVRLAVKYADKILRRYDEVFSFNFPAPSTYEKFLQSFDIIEEKYLTV